MKKRSPVKRKTTAPKKTVVVTKKEVVISPNPISENKRPEYIKKPPITMDDFDDERVDKPIPEVNKKRDFILPDYNWIEIPRSIMCLDGHTRFKEELGVRDVERVKLYSNLLVCGYKLKDVKVSGQNCLFLFEK